MDNLHQKTSPSNKSFEQTPKKTLPKTTKVPALICTIITIFALIVLIVGLWLKNPYWIIAGIIPAAIYEAWRTQGYYTKIVSVGIVVLVALEVLAILNIIKINLAQVFQLEQMYFQGYYLPLGEINFVFPALVVICSLILVYRTFGIYTKWLSIVLLANSTALLYLINQQTLIQIIRYFIY